MKNMLTTHCPLPLHQNGRPIEKRERAHLLQRRWRHCLPSPQHSGSSLSSWHKNECHGTVRITERCNARRDVTLGTVNRSTKCPMLTCEKKTEMTWNETLVGDLHCEGTPAPVDWLKCNLTLSAFCMHGQKKHQRLEEYYLLWLWTLERSAEYPDKESKEEALKKTMVKLVTKG